MALAQNQMLLSAMESQYRSSASFKQIGSLISTPWWLTKGTYLPCPTFCCDRSRGARIWARRPASGPFSCTWRSTATSHWLTPLISRQYSASGSPKADALAEKTVDKLEADVMTGIPVGENRIAVDADTVKGTQHEKRFQAVLELSKQEFLSS